MSAAVERLARHCAECHNDAHKVAVLMERTAMLPKTRAKTEAFLMAARYALLMAADTLGLEAGVDPGPWMDEPDAVPTPVADPVEEETVRERGGIR